MDPNKYASIVVRFVHEFSHSKNKEVINLDKKIVHTNMDVRIRSTYTQKASCNKICSDLPTI